MEGEVGRSPLRKTKLFPRPFGYQKSLSPLIELRTVDVLIKQASNKIVKLELTKSYYRLNR